MRNGLYRILTLFEILLFRAAFLVVPLVIDLHAAEHTRPVKGAVLAFLALSLWGTHLVRSGLRGGFRIANNRFLLPVTCLPAAAWISLLYSPCLSVGLEAGLIFFSGWTFFWFSAIHFHGKEVRLTAGILIGAAFLASCTGWTHILKVDFLFGDLSRDLVWSTLGNPNFAGQYLIMVIPWILFAFDPRARLQRALRYFVLIVVSGFLIAVVARGAWLGIVFGLGTVYLLQRKSLVSLIKNPKFEVAVLMLIVIFLGVIHGGGYSSEKTAQSWRGFRRTALLRVHLSEGTLRMISHESALGVGLGGWYVKYPLYRGPDVPWLNRTDYDREGAAHNDWLEWISETGILGTIALLFMIGVFLRAWRKDKLHTLGGPHRACLVGVLAGAVQASLSTNFQRPSALLLFSLAIGFLGIPPKGTDNAYSRRDEIPKDDSSHTSVGPFPKRYPLLFLGLAVLFLPATIGTPQYRAMRLLGESLTAKNHAATLKEDSQKEARIKLYASAEELAGKAERLVAGHPRILEAEGSAVLGQAVAAEGAEKGKLLDRAEGILREALESDPYSFNLHVLLGKVALERFDYQAAEEEFGQVVAIAPLHKDGQCSLGRLLARRGDYTSAIQHLEKALSLPKKEREDPEPEIRYYLGLSYLGQKDYQTAAKHFRQVLILLPDNEEHRKEREAAKTFLDRAILPAR